MVQYFCKIVVPFVNFAVVLAGIAAFFVFMTRAAARRNQEALVKISTARAAAASKEPNHIYHRLLSFGFEKLCTCLGWWDRPDSNRRFLPLLYKCAGGLTPLSHVAGLSRLSSCRFRVCFNTDDERLPRVRIPIRFRGVSMASTLWAYLWARMRRGGRGGIRTRG